MFKDFEDSVEQPRIDEIFISGQSEPVLASAYLKKNRRDYSEIRLIFETAILNGNPIARCAACHRPVKPRLSTKRRRYFKHDGGDGNCSYQTSGEASQRQIDAMRYNGKKEGPEHIRLKELLVTSLSNDIAFNNIQVETRWWSVVDPEKWKKPDVTANNLGLSVAFEIQLSTTFLNVMADRRRFYLENDGLLMWIFKDVHKFDCRQFQDDTFYNNNSNLFVIDDETTKLSIENNELNVRCHYLEPVIHESIINEEWREIVVKFSQLHIDKESQRIFYYDFSEAYQKAKTDLLDAEHEHLRCLFLEYWTELGLYATGSKGMAGNWPNKWNKIVNEFEKRGITLPYDRPDHDIARFSCLFFSIYYGRCIGFAYEPENLLRVANYAYDNCKDILWYFGDLLNRTKRWKIIDEQDKASSNKKRKTGKIHKPWEDKWPLIKAVYRGKDPEYPQKRQFDHLYSFLLNQKE